MKSALKHYGEMLQSIRESGTYKNERIITTPQKARIDTTEAKNVLNMCANNYLGLSDSKELIEAAKASYDNGASASPPCASSAAPRGCTRSWSIR